MAQGLAEKEETFRRSLDKLGLEPRQACFVGDDLVDLPVLRMVGLAACPADAVAEVRKSAHLVTSARGGRGAVREVVEVILKAQGLWHGLCGSFRDASKLTRSDARMERRIKAGSAGTTRPFPDLNVMAGAAWETVCAQETPQDGMVLALLIGAYLGYVRAFAVVVSRLTAARKVDDFKFAHARFPEPKRGHQAGPRVLRSTITGRPWRICNYVITTASADSGCTRSTTSGSSRKTASAMTASGSGSLPPPSSGKRKDGSSTKTVTAEVATIDFNQPLSLNVKPDSEPIVVKYARLERNVMIRDDKGTPDDTERRHDHRPDHLCRLRRRQAADPQRLRGAHRRSRHADHRHRHADPASSQVGTGSRGRSAGFEGAQHAQLNQNVDVVFHDIGKTGFLPGSVQTKKTAPGKVEVKAQVDSRQGGRRPRPRPSRCRWTSTATARCSWSSPSRTYR